MYLKLRLVEIHASLTELIRGQMNIMVVIILAEVLEDRFVFTNLSTDRSDDKLECLVTPGMFDCIESRSLYGWEFVISFLKLENVEA